MAPDLASRIVWFDSFVSNVDRTARNTNMLLWHRAPWLIDHGSSLYFHHSEGWAQDAARPRAAFPAIRDHVLLQAASLIRDQDAALAAALTPETIDRTLALVPAEWTVDLAPYRRYFRARLAAPRPFVEEAAGAR
jgi:hypothetical protein